MVIKLNYRNELNNIVTKRNYRTTINNIITEHRYITSLSNIVIEQSYVKQLCNIVMQRRDETLYCAVVLALYQTKVRRSGRLYHFTMLKCELNLNLTQKCLILNTKCAILKRGSPKSEVS